MTIKEIEEEALMARGAWNAIRDLVSECKECKKGRSHVEYLDRAAGRYKLKMERYESLLDKVMTENIYA